jgi:hypothetical protein
MFKKLYSKLISKLVKDVVYNVKRDTDMTYEIKNMAAVSANKRIDILLEELFDDTRSIYTHYSSQKAQTILSKLKEASVAEASDTFKLEYKNIAHEFIHSEEFVDTIVNRILKKQLIK